MKRKISFLWLLLLAGAANALTLSEIETRIRLNIRDTGTTLQRYSDSTIDNLINDGGRDVVNQTWCLDKTTTLSLTVGTTFFSLPSDLNAIKFVYFRDTSSNTYELQEKNERSFRQSNPDWQKQTGKPVNYFTRTSTSAGTTFELALYPIPSTSTQLGTVTIDYYSQWTDLSSDSDIPFDSQVPLYPFHQVLIDYATARIKIMEGRTDEAALYGTLYTNGISLLNSKYGQKPNWNPSFMGVTK